MANGTASLTQFSQIVNFFTTAIASVINEFSIVDLINCLSKKGEKLTQFMRLVLQALMEGKEIIIDYTKKIIKIDQLNSFDPVKFIGEGWSVVEQDTRLLSISEIEADVIQLSSFLKTNEISVNGEKRLKRLKNDGRIRLGAEFFFSLWNNQQCIPESWTKKINGNIKYIMFDGTILQSPDGQRNILCLYWNNGEWYWYCLWLGNHFGLNRLSAMLPSKK